MKLSKNLFGLNRIFGTMTLVALGQLNGATTIVSANVYRVDQGVTFSIGNNGTNDFLFSWTDSSGTFTDIADPTFQVGIGESYVFERVTTSHPFVITDSTLPVFGDDGSYLRLTSDGAVIDAATLTPIADFTANPAPTTDSISWTPGSEDSGDYYYTCRITGHNSQIGKITVMSPIPEPTGIVLVGISVIAGLGMRRR